VWAIQTLGEEHQGTRCRQQHQRQPEDLNNSADADGIAHRALFHQKAMHDDYQHFQRLQGEGEQQGKPEQAEVAVQNECLQHGCDAEQHNAAGQLQRPGNRIKPLGHRLPPKAELLRWEAA
jgi:hypothetical protein